MKLLRVFSLLLGMALAFSFCSDEKEAPLVPLYPYDDVELSVIEGEKSPTSCSFQVEPSNEQAPYLCLYVKQDVFIEVSKDKLPTFLMNELKKQAQEKGEDFETYVAAATFTGKQVVELQNLTPGTVYELVAFAVSGTKPAKKSSYQFFQTPYIDPIDCAIELVSIEKKDGNIFMEMKPALDDEYWYIAAMTKAGYENALQSFSPEEIFMTLFKQQAANMTIEEICQKLLIKGSRKIGFKMPQGIGDCVWMAAVLRPFGENELILASQVSRGEFNPDNLTRSVNLLTPSEVTDAFFFEGSVPTVEIARP